MDKFDIHNSEKNFNYYLNRIDTCSMSNKQKNQIKKFIKEAKIGLNSKKKVGNHRLIANLQSFFKLHDYFKKDFDKVTQKEFITFAEDLENDRIKQNSGKIYKPSSKNELVRNIKRFLKTILPEDIYRKRVSWIKQEEEISNVPAYELEDIEKVAMDFKNLRDKTLTMVLGDGGLRIEEALNLKISNVIKKEKRDNQGKKTGEEYYILDIKISKTLPRKISVPYATPLLTKWLKHHPAITDKEAYLFPTTYDYYRKLLRQHGKKVLGASVVLTPHTLRHSSATHYSKTDLGKNLFKFCYRYGWAFSSNMPKRYIDRELFEEEAQQELDNMVKNSKVNELENENMKIKERLKNIEKFMNTQGKIYKIKLNKNLGKFGDIVSREDLKGGIIVE